VTLGPGKTFCENPDHIHVAGRNATKTSAAKFLAFFVKEAGAPAPVTVP
jgi:hypothetical protein